MNPKILCAGALCLAFVQAGASGPSAGARAFEPSGGARAFQASVARIPRPPVIKVGPEDGSAAPDGYAPIPEWLGQTRAPRPAKTAEYSIENVAEGFSGAFCFSFLPDGRIIVGERPG